MQRFGSLSQEWYQYLDDDLNELELIDDYLESLINPFDFLAKQQVEAGKALTAEDREDLKAQTQGDNKYH